MGKSNTNAQISLLLPRLLWVLTVTQYFRTHKCSVFLLSDKIGCLHDGAVCSVTKKLNIERQGTEHAKQTPVKILCFTDEFMEK